MPDITRQFVLHATKIYYKMRLIFYLWSFSAAIITASPPHIRASQLLEFGFDIPPRIASGERLENGTNLQKFGPEKRPKLENHSNLLVEKKIKLGDQLNVGIVGGQDAVPGEFPFQVSVQVIRHGKNYHFCGGSVYNEFYVLTAAHCAYAYASETLYVVAGDHNLYKDDGTEQVRKIEKRIPHEMYSKFIYGFCDIALLKVKTKFTFNKFVQPVPIEANLASLDISKTLCTTTGWGDLGNGKSPQVLQKVDIPLVSDDLCQELYPRLTLFPKQNVCTGYMKGGKSPCYGDRGGPLTCNGTIVGLTSWVRDCEQPRYPAVYMEVPFFLDWIEFTI